ncbi:MAG: prepilin-type N-terminal cleavage/methylation domain-containing protein [Chthoniobacterales bacterium]|mgnify:CR=1 FL=1|nr:prepilin-type N-terminal cleavage/methylation domain-containing protein [Chthoniobacterales bacterium]
MKGKPPPLALKYQTKMNAFTLVEILAVAAIVAILAALLFPLMRDLTDRSAGVGCAANMRSLGAILQAYRAEHDGYFPTGIEGKKLLPPANVNTNPNPQASANVTKALREGGYLAENETPLCPAMRLSPKGIAALKNDETAKSRLLKTGSYGLNVFLLQVKPEALSGGAYWWGNNPYPGDSKMLFLAELHAGIGGWEGLTWSESQWNYALDGADFGTAINVRGRHHGHHSLNFLFLDGHAAKVAPKLVPGGGYDWTESFDSWGRNGKFINAKRLWE